VSSMSRTFTVEDFQRWGRRGGKAGTGKAKARTPEQAAEAGRARWKGVRRETKSA